MVQTLVTFEKEIHFSYQIYPRKKKNFICSIHRDMLCLFISIWSDIKVICLQSADLFLSLSIYMSIFLLLFAWCVIKFNFILWKKLETNIISCFYQVTQSLFDEVDDDDRRVKFANGKNTMWSSWKECLIRSSQFAL